MSIFFAFEINRPHLNPEWDRKFFIRFVLIPYHPSIFHLSLSCSYLVYLCTLLPCSQFTFTGMADRAGVDHHPQCPLWRGHVWGHRHLLVKETLCHETFWTKHMIRAVSRQPSLWSCGLVHFSVSENFSAILSRYFIGNIIISDECVHVHLVCVDQVLDGRGYWGMAMVCLHHLPLSLSLALSQSCLCATHSYRSFISLG